jgi:hypothetical protein
MASIKTYSTPLGELTINFIGHASVYFQINGLNIYVDPYTKEADFSTYAKGDLVYFICGCLFSYIVFLITDFSYT